MGNVNVLLAFTVVIIIICIYWYWYMMVNIPTMKHLPYDKIQFKTGDIILFHAYDNINPIFIGSFWGHIGIVYKDPDEVNAKPLLFEAARTSKMKNCQDYNRHGIMITDLKSRIEKYPGLTAIKKLNSPVNDEIIRGFFDLIKYAKKNMYYNEDIFYNAIKKKKGCKFNNSTNCGELVLLSLIKLALLPESILYDKIAHHLLYTASLEQLQNNYYHKPVEITYTPF